MHGLILRSFETYIVQIYGEASWGRAVSELEDGLESFEPMFHYEDDVATEVLAACHRAIGKPEDILLEDFGTYLVANPSSERVRRLLRFGGIDYEDFLQSLEDLPGRARLAVGDLDMPEIEVIEGAEGQYTVSVPAGAGHFGHVLTGALRALADDYGALVFVEHMGAVRGREEVTVQLLEARFAEGRTFDLASGAGGM